MKKYINKLPKIFKWVPHNMIGHPVSEVFYILSVLYNSERFEKIANNIHDNTIPDHIRGEGRG